jgi:hypothetical protein
MQLLGNSGDYDIVITEMEEQLGTSFAYIESVRQEFGIEHNAMLFI